MRIKKIVVENFGPFQEYRIEFRQKGLNIISGLNATGKTQLFGAFLFVLLGNDVLKKPRNESNLPSTVLIETQEKDSTQILEYSILRNTLTVNFQNIDSFAINKLDFNRHYTSHYHEKRALFFNGINIHNFEVVKSHIEFISSLLEDDTHSLNLWNSLIKNYLTPLLFDKSEKIFVGSMGVEQILMIVGLISYHSELNYNSPLILDDILGVFDNPHRTLIISILRRYAESNQVILFCSDSSLTIDTPEEVVSVLPLPKNYYSTYGYDYNFDIENLVYNHDLYNSKTNIVRYVKDSILNEEEYRFVEFKEVKGLNPVNSILDLVDQYVVAYLNENSMNIGRIIWGVTDEERKVVGVNLLHKQRDDLRKLITDKLGQIKPQLTPSLYKVSLQQVHDEKLREITDLYVIEVTVHPHTGDFLYATAKNEVFIKTDGGKRKLTALEIQQEILYRSKSTFKKR